MPAMDTFTFSVATGPVSVHFHPAIAVPRMPAAGGIYVADSNTLSLLQQAEGFDTTVPVAVIPAGESSKTLRELEKILSLALEAGLGRDSLFVGFGGGVVTDMTAFAASIYMRGAQVELVPTTLLAMADAAVGGKTAVDFENYKNCVGTFYPARAIHVSVAALESLPEAEFLSGLAEVFKTALLYAPKLFQILSERRTEILDRNPELLLDAVKRCVQAKAHVVERDLRESGERMFLNFGHTFAHALESVAGFGAVTHGDAVAWGIARALALGERLGITDPEYRAEVLPALTGFGWSADPIHPFMRRRVEAGQATETEIATALLAAMKSDKKKRNGVVKFVLQREMNSTLVTEVDDAEVLAVLS